MQVCLANTECEVGSAILAMYVALPVSVAFVLCAFCGLVFSWNMLFKKSWDPRGKHCYVTGGSAGLGLSLAVLLAKKGANVSVVARDRERLQLALGELEKVRQSPNQILKVYSFGLDDATAAAEALEAACQGNGIVCPDAVFLCAGASRPGFFIEETETSMKSGMDKGYWVQAWSALAATKRMARHRISGKIIFVSSLLGFMSIAGYSSYSPAKFALRGLAETLRSELLLYSISVHIFFPGTMFTPGYKEENKTKPKITLKIEEGDQGLQADQAAERLLSGVQNGHFHIAQDLTGELFRASTRGSSPHNNTILDCIYTLVGWLGLTIWRRNVDSAIKHHRPDHEKYLADRHNYLSCAQFVEQEFGK